MALPVLSLPQMQLPSEGLLRAQQIQQSEAQTRALNQQTAINQQEAQRKSALLELTREAQTNPQALQVLASVSPETAKQIQDFQERQIMIQGKIAQTFDMLNIADKEKAYPLALQELKRNGISTEDLPTEYDPEKVNNKVKFAIGMARDLEKQIGSRQIVETGQGIFTVDPMTGQAIPIKSDSGQQLKKKEEKITPITEIGKLREDLKQGFITQEEFNSATKDLRNKNNKGMSSDTAKTLAIVTSGLDSIASLRKFSENKNYSTIAGGSKLPDIIRGQESKRFAAISNNLTDTIGRLRSGGAINKDEEARFLSLLPAPLDNKETRDLKLNKLETELILTKQNIQPEGSIDQTNNKNIISPYPEGTTIVNKNTGQRMIMRGGEWQSI